MIRRQISGNKSSISTLYHFGPQYMTTELCPVSLQKFIEPYMGCIQSPFSRNSVRYKKSKSVPIRRGILIGFGNPLLDITTSIKDTQLLDKYGLQANAAILAEDKHLPLFEELASKKETLYSAGGSCMNTIRVFQWLNGTKYGAVYFGAVGNDKYGKTLNEKARGDGVDTQFFVKDGKPTGTCAVIISGHNRSLIANLGAASSFTDDHMASDLNKCIVDNATYYYITGFFLQVCPPTVLRVAKISHEKKGTLIINLSAVFIMSTHKKQLDELMPYVDILIGNKEEMTAFAEVRKWNTKDIEEIGRKCQCWEKKSKKPRIVIITDGQKPILVFLANGIQTFPIPEFDAKKIVDTNGCGDSFVGGFLLYLCKEKKLDFCIKSGIWAAQEILKVVGVTLEKWNTKDTHECKSISMQKFIQNYESKFSECLKYIKPK